jgi:GGDEF domain-containing protein
VISPVQHVKHFSRRPTLPPIYAGPSHWYEGWYLELRLEEELARSARYHLPPTLLNVHLDQPPRRAAEQQKLDKRLLDILIKGLRRSDIAGIFDQNELAVLLPHTNERHAEIVAGRLKKALADYSPLVGTATYPKDGNEPAVLFAVAEHHSGASARDQSVFGETRARQRTAAKNGRS